MLDVCAEVEILSTTIPLALPVLLAGKDAVLLTVAGGHDGLPVTLMDTRHPMLPVWHAPTMGLTLLASSPTLKKIESTWTPVAPVGRHGDPDMILGMRSRAPRDQKQGPCQSTNRNRSHSDPPPTVPFRVHVMPRQGRFGRLILARSYLINTFKPLPDC